MTDLQRGILRVLKEHADDDVLQSRPFGASIAVGLGRGLYDVPVSSLKALERKGLVGSDTLGRTRRGAFNPPRRYWITDTGRAALAQEEA